MAGGRDERVRELFFVPSTANPTDEGQVVLYNDDLWVLLDGSIKSLTASAGGGITPTQHAALRQLIHFIAEGPAETFASGAYKETTGTVFPTSAVWWESSSKLKKIVSLDVTWTGPSPTTEVWKVYDTDGTTVLATVTDTITYSGIFETSRTRAVA